VNNVLEVLAPKPGNGNFSSINPEDSFSKLDLVPVGIYAISEELDSKYVFSDLGLAQELLLYKPGQISGIEIRTKPNTNEAEVIEAVTKICNNKVAIKTRAQRDSLQNAQHRKYCSVSYIYFGDYYRAVQFNWRLNYDGFG
jgi:lipoprotein-releasing system permease protein